MLILRFIKFIFYFIIGEFLITRVFIFFTIIFLFTSCTTKRTLIFTPKPSPSLYNVIISSSSQINSIENLHLRNLYLRKDMFIKKQKIIPVNLLASNKARIAFESSILKMDRKSLNKYWIEQHLQDVKPPISQKSYNAVLNFVINVDGAIGYIPHNIKNDKVKVINEF